MMYKNFVNTICLLTLMVIGLNLKAQENDGPRELKDKTYIIIDNGSVMNIQPYIDAMNNSNMMNHRLKDKHYTITFQTGVKVELFSAKEIIANGWNVQLSNYPETFDHTRDEPIFALGANNYIIEYHTSKGKK